MSGATEEDVIKDANEAALQEFEESLARSIKQYKTGLVKTFKTKEEFFTILRTLSKIMDYGTTPEFD
jgi:hypothetical protein